MKKAWRSIFCDLHVAICMLRSACCDVEVLYQFDVTASRTGCAQLVSCLLTDSAVLLQLLQKLSTTMSTDDRFYVCQTELLLCRFRSPYWKMLFVIRRYPHCMFEIALLFPVHVLYHGVPWLGRAGPSASYVANWTSVLSDQLSVRHLL